MPDLLSHLLFGLIACELANPKKKGLILLGTVFPDLITKIFLFGFIVNLPKELASALALFHSFIPLFLVVILVGLFFKDYFSAIYLIGVGALSHILLDVLNTHYIVGIRLFLPFSWRYFRIDGFWPDQYIWILIPFLIVYIFIRVYKRLKTGKFVGLKFEKHL